MSKPMHTAWTRHQQMDLSIDGHKGHAAGVSDTAKVTLQQWHSQLARPGENGGCVVQCVYRYGGKLYRVKKKHAYAINSYIQAPT